MRKLKAKKEKVAKKKTVSNIPATIKNQIMKQNHLIEMQNNVVKDLCNASLLLAIAGRYLKKHRLAWDKEGAYLKPSLKGLLTKIVHQFEKFEDKLEKGVVDKIKDDLNKKIIDGMKGDFAEMEEKNFSANDCEIFKTFALCGVCVGAVEDRLKNLTKNSEKTAKQFSEALKIYDRYLKFWETEIDTFDVSFQK